MQIKDVLSINPERFRKISYRYWENDSSENTLFCIPGVTRNSRDFEYLSERLVSDYSVYCPDLAGRGLSRDIESIDELMISNYVLDISSIISANDCHQIDLLGTSMGGIVSMFLASKKKTPVRKLILNDVGPLIPKEIFQAVAIHEKEKPKGFGAFDEAVQYHKTYCSGFGPMDDEQWEKFTLSGMKENEQGRYVYDYHPLVQEKILLESPKEDINLWHLWDKIDCPVLVLRGAESYALPKKVAEEMANRGPKATVIEFEGTGHAPNLMNDEHVGIIKNWLSD